MGLEIVNMLCVCGQKAHVGVPLVLTNGLVEDQVNLSKPSSQMQTRICTHTQTHRQPNPHKQSYLLQKKQYKIPDTNTHKHHLAHQPQEHQPKSHTVNKPCWLNRYTHKHTPSASVLSSECPFRLLMLEICPFFSKIWKRHREQTVKEVG